MATEQIENPEPEELDVSSEEICKKYRAISRNRPPFSYEASEPKYPQIDEKRLFAMEKRMFDLTSYPKPQSANVHLTKFYAKLEKAHGEMAENIEDIKTFDSYHTPEADEELKSPLVGRVPHHEIVEQVIRTRRKTGLRAKGTNLPASPSKTMFDIERTLWEKHYGLKKRFIDHAFAYLYLMEGEDQEQMKKVECVRFRREVYAMFIGHQATQFSRSASHELGPLRRTGEPTIMHPYQMTVHGINFWLQKIDQAESKEQESIYWDELYFEIIEDAFHDTMEDHFVTPDDLAQKIIEMINLDFRVSTPMRRADSKKRRIPTNIHFADLNRDRITRDLWALTEEEEDKKPGKPYYFARKIVSIDPKDRACLFLRKVRDRISNLLSPKYKKAGKTLEKIHETLAILELGIALLLGKLTHSEVPDPITPLDLVSEISTLIDVCKDQLNQYESSNEFSRIKKQNPIWGDYLEITRTGLSNIEENIKRVGYD